MWYQLLLVLPSLLEAARQGDQCSSSPESACTWPKPSDYANIGKGNFCSFGDAHLKGIADFGDLRRTILNKGVQVLTDLDDTLFCSGGGGPIAGVALAGVDANCKGTERHGLYPGVADFYYAVALGSQESKWGETIATTVIPFSARPIVMNSGLQLIGRGIQLCKGYDLAIRKAICHDCQSEDDCNNDKCNCFGFNAEAAEYGYSNLSEARDIYSDNFMHMANLKFKAWKKKSFDKPTVFIGDTGQGDFWAAQMMLVESQKIGCTSSSCTGRVVAAFMHDVNKTCQADACRKAWKAHNIFFFNDYAEAAELAEKVGLVTVDRVSSAIRDKISIALQKSAAQAPQKGYGNFGNLFQSIVGNY